MEPSFVDLVKRLRRRLRPLPAIEAHVAASSVAMEADNQLARHPAVEQLLLVTEAVEAERLVARAPLAVAFRSGS